MKIDTIQVNEFSTQEEYPGVTTEPNGETRLLYGPNVSGKTVTFSAIAHATVHDAMGFNPGAGSSIDVQFTDGTHLHRGYPETTFETGGHDTESENVQTRMDQVLGPRPILEAYFVHSDHEKLPLTAFDTERTLDLVRSVTVPDVQGKISTLREKQHERERELTTVRGKREETESRIESHNAEIEEIDSERETAEKIVRLGNTGQLEQIGDALDRRDEVAAELEELFAKREEVESKLREVSERHEDIKNALADPGSQVLDAVSDETCPVCEQTVPEASASERLEEGECPLCGLDRSINSYRDQFVQEKQDAHGQIDDVREQKEELEARLEELDTEIEETRSERPELSEFDAETMRRLEEHDRELAAVVAAARKERDNAKKRLDRKRNERDRTEERREEYQRREKEIGDKIRDLKTKISKRQKEARDGVEAFTQIWRNVLEEMSGTIRREIEIRSEDGVVAGGDPERVYNREKNNLSQAEEQLLNLSFVVAVNEAVDSDRAAFDTLFLDEPLARFDETVRDEVLGFILNDDTRQYIFTSSDEAVSEQVPDTMQQRLEKNDDAQWELGDLEEKSSKE
jgi:DNA repair exonuclease SbcCD ATPase subunit